VVTQNGNRVTVDTGSATFVVGGSVDSLFDEIRLADDTLVAAEGAHDAVVNGTPTDHLNLRSVRLERSGPLAASVVVEGNYDLARWVVVAWGPSAATNSAPDPPPPSCGMPCSGRAIAAAWTCCPVVANPTRCS
jgi:hypothetical protein